MGSRLSERARKTVIVLGAALVVGCFFLYVLKPQLDGFVDTRRKIRGLERELAAAEEVLAAQAAHRVALQKARAELRHLQRRFSADVTDGMMMAEIGAKAAAAGVDVVHFQPREVAEGEHLLEFPVKIGVRGDFPNVLTFMELLRSLPNTAQIREFAIHRERKPEAGRVWADFLLVIYSEKNPTRARDLSAGDQGLRDNPFEPAASAGITDGGLQGSGFAVDQPAYPFSEPDVK
ncbi:type IV pilus inner membrane component PilO [Candidatus Desulforudis audaxviator]|uniref:Uncharacterized protein n=1 Tax=Desulforudis audaxviator (strain MP104C) TaxID=477974 RepID=B1I3B5_DESAP|nr:type 4a pilus biogenesis protein PilO [Candidatus Desulforudis audaxviator]ACA59512.1 conserved hypothetical protein [Candidatus Desulforudis audaxviator MP104C]AZK59495.1 Type IV pilus biogenesis protein PilO [Candidatus Desulforudis audaxviator]